MTNISSGAFLAARPVFGFRRLPAPARIGDPIIYEVYEISRPEVAGELRTGLSVVHPGSVGSEYFMTKGHFHAVIDTAETYYCVKGHGVLLMENVQGDSAVEELLPGRAVYVAPGWAHRSMLRGGRLDHRYRLASRPEAGPRPTGRGA